MTKNKINLIIIFLFLLFMEIGFSREINLKPEYKKWLDLVSYIITPQEKSVFLSLKNDRERDMFIKLFWKQRDPTPGTPENEFKEEHIRRFNYANKYFKYGTTKPGWKTDMGKIYIILGPPVNREKIDAFGLEPMEVWSYYGGRDKGLPPHFQIVFFKRHGAGEFKIYDPAIDGPDSLLVKTSDVRDINPFDYQAILEKIQSISPSAAEVAFSLIPGEIPLDYQPSPSNSILISKVLESGSKNVSTKYAQDFLNFKGVVNVEYATEYVEANSRVDIFKDFETGINFVHFAISPKRISVDYSKVKDKYYFIYRLTVSLSKGGSVIYQYSKTFPFYFDEEEIKNIVSKGFVISDLFPVIPGNYKLTVLIQNIVKNEFSYFDKKIKIKSEGKGLPEIYGPIVGFSFKKDNSFVFRPYKIENNLISFDPKNGFLPNDKIFVLFCVDSHNYGKKIKGKVLIKSKLGYSEYQKKKYFNIDENFKNDCFVSKFQNPGVGSYRVNVILNSSGNVPLVSRETYFTVSPVRNIIHPTVAYKVLSKKNIFLYYWALGSQFYKEGKFKEAFENYSKAFNLRSNYYPLTKEYADLLLQMGKNNEAIKVIENMKLPKKMFDYYFFKGRALLNLKNYKDALDSFLKANKIYDSDYKLINLIGITYVSLKDYDNALKVFKASLKINPHQDSIKRIIDKLEKTGKKG